MDTILATFCAALRSVGTAATMATAGFYLHRRGIIAASEKKALARISQQVTIPCLFFTKIINCPQNFSYKKCPNFSDNLADVWWLLFWPLFVVGCGLLVGEVAVFLSHTPKQQRPSVLAAVAFANSTGLPITLLTVIHANFPPTSEIGRVDPNLFLSVYLILYPVLQWGVGWWLLSPEETGYRESELLTLSTIESDGSTELDGVASDMIRELSLSDLMTEKTHRRTTIEAEEDKELIPKKTVDTNSATYGHDVHENAIPPLTMTGTLARALPKALQPPVIAALAGLFITAFVPLRGLFVDLHDRDDDAPLEWLFDGLMLIGQAAIPINMSILGINLSLTSQRKPSKHSAVSGKTIAATVIAKMIVMPCLGILSAIILKNYIWNIPDDIDGPFYLVLMIVTITPTANTVMVMVELSESDAKEGMARIIGWQYVCAPLILSITVMMTVQVAGMW